MISPLRAEIAKLKRSSHMYLTLLCSMLPTAVSAMIVLTSGERHSWHTWYSINLQFQALLAAPLLFALLSGYIVAREYQDKTIDILFSYPFSRSSIYISKLIVIVLAIVGILMVTYVVNGALGILLLGGPPQGGVLAIYLRLYAAVSAILLAFVPLWMYVSMVGKSFVPAVGISILIIMIPGPAGGSEAYRASIGWLRQAVEGEGSWLPLTSATFALLAGFLCFLVLSLRFFARSDNRNVS